MVQFYVYDTPREVLARHLLLLQIVHDWELPIRHRANIFLEVFGNVLVQERTARYIAQKGRELVDLACNERGALGDMVDLSLLRHRERDELVDVFHSWAENVPFEGNAGATRPLLPIPISTRPSL